MADINKQVIAGHGRVLACIELGIGEVPTLIADDLTEAEVRALMLADNKLTENASWDDELLAKNFSILSDLDLSFDLDITGFDYGDIERFLILGEGSGDNQEEQSSVIEPVHVVSQAGDIWQLGKHKIICANSLEADTYSKLLGKKKASLIFSDPPYNLPAKTIGKVCDQSHGDFAHARGEISEGQVASIWLFLDERYYKYDSGQVGDVTYIPDGKGTSGKKENTAVWQVNIADTVIDKKQGNILDAWYQHKNRFKDKDDLVNEGKLTAFLAKQFKLTLDEINKQITPFFRIPVDLTDFDFEPNKKTIGLGIERIGDKSKYSIKNPESILVK